MSETAPQAAPGSTPAPISPSAPAERFRHGLRLLLAGDIPGWVGLWAEDGVMEFPFAPPEWPRRLEGREAVADYMRPYPDHIDLHDFPEADLRIHQTADPRTLVAEMRATGRLVRTGDPHDMAYVAVVTFDADGLITAYRDYWNPLAALGPGAAFAGSAR